MRVDVESRLSDEGNGGCVSLEISSESFDQDLRSSDGLNEAELSYARKEGKGENERTLIWSF